MEPIFKLENKMRVHRERADQPRKIWGFRVDDGLIDRVRRAAEMRDTSATIYITKCVLAQLAKDEK